ncbi:DUF1385 domain-containing protein [Intestinibacillus massiliensis]|uniref:DUF1385 domain-containing protein n=1 Tax=Intestinibacillus massiliensis TaxID=1871029 RepID=UPI000B35E673|nr:DUF1385 domain-containing protein [Intestinibacillus massiliensis]
MNHQDGAQPCPMKKTTIGGQAIIEGIVMKGPRKSSTVVRKSDGELVIRDKDAAPLTEKSKVFGWPVVRGMVTLFMALKDGMEAINYSAQFFDDEEDAGEPSKFEQWLEKCLGSQKLEKLVMGFATVVGIALPVALFILLPTFLAGFLPEGVHSVVRNLIEGAVRVIIFLCFMWGVSHMKDIRRTFEYHGAEHKTIFCYEAGEELTVENVRRQGRFHPRCGTSFLFVVIIIATLVSSLVFAFIQPTNPFVRALLHLLLLPLVVGLSYEVNRYAGRKDNTLTRALRWPGLKLQRLTVFEPDDSMIEVAIEAMRRVIPDDGSDNW